jgi:hypothetical protein
MNFIEINQIGDADIESVEKISMIRQFPVASCSRFTSQSGRALLPLNGTWGFARDIVNHSVNAFDFVADSV